MKDRSVTAIPVPSVAGRGATPKLAWALGALLLLAVIALPSVLNPYYLHVLVIGLLYSYLAASWNIIGGYAGQMSLGHAMFFGIGSYAVAVFAREGWFPLITALPVAILISALLAWLVASICFRYALRGIYFAVGTLLLGEILRISANSIQFFGRSQGLQITPRAGVLNFHFETDAPYFFIFLVLAACMIFGALKLERSKLGYHLIALREQEDGAKALGVDTQKVKRIAFVLSAMLTAVAGFMYASVVRFVEPGYDLSISITLIMIMGAVLGGRGTAVGPFVGGLIVVLVQELLTAAGSWVGTTAFSALAQVIYGLFFVVTLLVFPRGLVGEWTRRRADSRARLLESPE